ncbi:MAG: hypothetical protein V2A58_15110 [Planctomycetota bacterium]
MSSYTTDRTWSDQFIPELRRVIGPYVLVPSSLEQDRREASDLVVFQATRLTIACRVRRAGYSSRYPNQFTIRSKRTSGAKTELMKLIEGWGDWFFYGHAAETTPTLTCWWLLNLAAWRAALILDGRLPADTRHIISGRQVNPDGATEFQWFDITSFPSALVIAHSGLQ